MDGGIIDLGGVTLVALRALPEKVVTPALRRIIKQLESGTEPVAGFQSAVDPPSQPVT